MPALHSMDMMPYVLRLMALRIARFFREEMIVDGELILTGFLSQTISRKFWNRSMWIMIRGR